MTRVFKSGKPSRVSLDKNDFSNPNICSEEIFALSVTNNDFVLSKRFWYKSRSDWVSKTDPSSAINDFLLILLNKNSERNTIAINIKIAIANKVISIKFVKYTIYHSVKWLEMGNRYW